MRNSPNKRVCRQHINSCSNGEKKTFQEKEKMLVTRENACYQHFLLFPTMFSKGFFPRLIKSHDCVLTLSQTSPSFYVSAEAVQVF